MNCIRYLLDNRTSRLLVDLTFGIIPCQIFYSEYGEWIPSNTKEIPPLVQYQCIVGGIGFLGAFLIELQYWLRCKPKPSWAQNGKGFFTTEYHASIIWLIATIFCSLIVAFM